MIEFLDKKYRRENFDGGKALLSNYLKTQAGQDINRKLSTCFVLADLQQMTYLSAVFRNIFRRNFRNHILQCLSLYLEDWRWTKNIKEKGLENFC